MPPAKIWRDWLRVLTTRVVLIWFVAVLVFQGVDVFENLREYTQAGAGERELLTFLLLRTPELAFQVLPAAVLLGVLLGVFHLARHKELTAAEAAGLHPGWLYGVAMALGAGLAGGQLALETGPLPELRAISDRYQAVRIERNPLRIETPVRWAVAGGDVWRIECMQCLAEGDRLDLHEAHYNMERYRRNGEALAVTLLSDVRVDGAAWQIGAVRQLGYPGAASLATEVNVAIPFLPAEVTPLRSKIRHENLADLRELAARKRELTGEVSQAALELHQRLSWALMSVTVLLAIVPYVPRHGRRASAASGVLLALGIGIVGWATIVFGTAYATNEKALIGFWLPHGFLLLTGLAGSTRIRAFLT